MAFIDFVDSTGVIQGILAKNEDNIKLFKSLREFKPESSVVVKGRLSGTKGLFCYSL